MCTRCYGMLWVFQTQYLGNTSVNRCWTGYLPKIQSCCPSHPHTTQCQTIQQWWEFLSITQPPFTEQVLTYVARGEDMHKFLAPHLMSSCTFEVTINHSQPFRRMHKLYFQFPASQGITNTVPQNTMLGWRVGTLWTYHFIEMRMTIVANTILFCDSTLSFKNIF